MSQLKRNEIVALDKRYLWHPYTAMEDYRRDVDPLVIERAAGSRLFDVDGTSYIDANASWWVSTLGHNHPRIVEALARQAQEMCHVALAGIALPGCPSPRQEPPRSGPVHSAGTEKPPGRCGAGGL